MTNIAYAIIDNCNDRCFTYWRGYDACSLTNFQNVDTLRNFMYDVICEPDQNIEILRKFYEHSVDVVKCTWINNDDGNGGEYTTTTDFPEYEEVYTMIKMANVLYARKFYEEDEKRIQECIAAQDAREKEMAEWLKNQVETKEG